MGGCSLEFIPTTAIASPPLPLAGIVSLKPNQWVVKSVLVANLFVVMTIDIFQ